ncbi:hypothetical protein YW7DRAFT_05605 [Streptomyces sp. AmelKG-E11A]|nr:hypothetical protein YW7DRAFT_05605 [Streptomyces sp. AmelKG-E11A]
MSRPPHHGDVSPDARCTLTRPRSPTPASTQKHPVRRAALRASRGQGCRQHASAFGELEIWTHAHTIGGGPSTRAEGLVGPGGRPVEHAGRQDLIQASVGVMLAGCGSCRSSWSKSSCASSRSARPRGVATTGRVRCLGIRRAVRSHSGPPWRVLMCSIGADRGMPRSAKGLGCQAGGALWPGGRGGCPTRRGGGRRSRRGRIARGRCRPPFCLCRGTRCAAMRDRRTLSVRPVRGAITAGCSPASARC